MCSSILDAQKKTLEPKKSPRATISKKPVLTKSLSESSLPIKSIPKSTIKPPKEVEIQKKSISQLSDTQRPLKKIENSQASLPRESKSSSIKKTSIKPPKEVEIPKKSISQLSETQRPLKKIESSQALLPHEPKNPFPSKKTTLFEQEKLTKAQEKLTKVQKKTDKKKYDQLQVKKTTSNLEPHEKSELRKLEIDKLLKRKDDPTKEFKEKHVKQLDTLMKKETKFLKKQKTETLISPEQEKKKTGFKKFVTSPQGIGLIATLGIGLITTLITTEEMKEKALQKSLNAALKTIAEGGSNEDALQNATLALLAKENVQQDATLELLAKNKVETSPKEDIIPPQEPVEAQEPSSDTQAPSDENKGPIVTPPDEVPVKVAVTPEVKNQGITTVLVANETNKKAQALAKEKSDTAKKLLVAASDAAQVATDDPTEENQRAATDAAEAAKTALVAKIQADAFQKLTKQASILITKLSQ